MCVTDCHDMIFGVKVALNPNTTKQAISSLSISGRSGEGGKK